MPTNVSFDRDERVYPQLEASFGIIPNSGGAATVGNANCARHISVELMCDETDIVREDKTGDRTQTASGIGRYLASWRANASLVSNGVAGVAPDWDPLFQCVFLTAPTLTASGSATVASCTTGSNYQVTFSAAHGMANYDAIWIPPSAAGAPWGAFVITVVSSTVVTLIGANSTVAISVSTIASRKCVAYALSDQPSKSMSLWRFTTPASLRQEVALGCVADSFGVSAGGNEGVKWTASGPAKWKLDSKSFADSIPDTDQKGGLTAFPTEPSAPVTNGTIQPAFMGYLVVNGVALPKVRSWNFTHTASIGLPQEYIGTRYGQTPEAGMRNTALDIVLDDDDAASSQALYELAQAKTAVDVIGVIGNLSAGNTFVFIFRGVQLKMPATESTGNKFARHYTGIAHGSGVATLDEVKMAIV